MAKFTILLIHGNEACDSKAHFEKHWSNNKKLHHKLKKIPVRFSEVDMNRFAEIQVKNSSGEVVRKEYSMALDQLSSWLLEELN